MKITGTRSSIDVEIGERTARFSGELGINGFYAVKNSIHWLSPHESKPITAEECNQIVEKIKEKSVGKEFQIFLINVKNKKQTARIESVPLFVSMVKKCKEVQILALCTSGKFFVLQYNRL